MARDEASHLEFLLASTAYRQFGFASFGDFVRERLGRSPRTVRRRIALHRITRSSPRLAVALDDGRVSPCQALLLQPVVLDESLPFWIELAETCTVRELEQRLANQPQSADSPSSGDGESSVDPQAPTNRAEASAAPIHESTQDAGRRITFAAPLSAAIAWDHAMEWARRMLGWEAPVHLCVEAILGEASADLNLPIGGDPSGAMPEGRPGRDSNSTSGDGECPGAGNPGTLADSRETHPIGPHAEDFTPGVPSRPASNPSPDPVTRRDPPRSHFPLGASDPRRESLRGAILETARGVEMAPPCTSHPPRDARTSVAFLDASCRRERQFRLLFLRLLREADSAGALAILGYRNLREFLETDLRLSPRTAARLLSESWLFEDNLVLARAFASGRIGLGQAVLVDRVAVSSSMEAFVRRAESVTHLQFERETRFLERLREYVPSVASRFHGPLPLPGLEEALSERLRRLGWSAARIEAELGVEPRAEPRGGLRGEMDGETDPAANPPLMRRLESLLELVALALCEHDHRLVRSQDGATGGPGDVARSRETAALVTSAAAGGSSAQPLRLPMLAAEGRHTAISFWAPQRLAADWTRAIEVVRARCGPLPTWAAAILLMERAVREWERTDPTRRPSESAILERDEWRCQAPGCSARRRLEVHHILFRSRGGSDTPANLVTLCHGHHRHGVHEGFLEIRGVSPEAVEWALGGGVSGFGTTRGPGVSQVFQGALRSNPNSQREAIRPAF